MVRLSHLNLKIKQQKSHTHPSHSQTARLLTSKNGHGFAVVVVYYESLKRELKTKTIYGFRCDEGLKTKVEESTRLTCTLLCAELEHLKIETRLIGEMLASEMGEYVFLM